MKRDNEKFQPERTEENRLIEYISKLLNLFSCLVDQAFY